MALMEPAPEIADYTDVPWFRRTWFLVSMILLFWPASLLIAATGDIYQKANRKMRQKASAEVWRSTGAGRAVMAGSGIILAALYVPQVVSALANDDGRDQVQAIAEPAASGPTVGRITAGQSPGSATGTTAVESPDADSTALDVATTAETSPAPEDAAGPIAEQPDPRQDVMMQRLDEVREETLRVASAIVDTSDLDVAARAFFGDDRFAATPIPGDGRVRTASGGMSSEDGLQSFLSAQLLSDRSIDEIAAEMSLAISEAGWTGEERSEQTEEGRRTIEIDVEPKTLEGYDSISVTIEETEEGPVQTRIFRFLGEPDDATNSSLLGRSRTTFPFPDDFAVVDVEISVRRNDATIRIVAEAPDLTEQELVEAGTEAAAPTWSVDRVNGTIITLASDDMAATLFPFSSDRRSTLTVRIE